jgi:serpin B
MEKTIGARMAVVLFLLGLFIGQARAEGISITLNGDTFGYGDRMDVSMAANADEIPLTVADVYLAVVLPGCSVRCVAADGGFAEPNQITAAVHGWPVETVSVEPALSLTVPAGLPLGTYSWVLVLCPPNSDVMNPANWSAHATAQWGLFEVLQSSTERNTLLSIPPSDTAELVAGNTEFALDLYQELKIEEGNLFYSPYSISLALAMTYAGARGDTERQMAQTLGFTLPQDRLHPAFNALDLELLSRAQTGDQNSESFRLNIANSIWVQTGYAFLPGFLEVLGTNYGAGMRLLDFANEPEDSRLVINDWVSHETEGKIEDLIPEGGISPLTRLVLTNAIYFNAAWAFPFPEEATGEGTFHLLNGGERIVAMMSQTAVFRHASGIGYKAIDLPYQGNKLSMVVLLPDSGAFDDFEASLDASRLDAILSALSPAEIRLLMPKFTFESTYSLAEKLSALGMTDAFSSKLADFSGMDGTRELLISDVLHKTFVAVDETGTEAAAATAVIVGITGIPTEPVPFNMDRPFIFFIRDVETGAILFVGRVLNPAP